jgi:hypothetical protein
MAGDLQSNSHRPDFFELKGRFLSDEHAFVPWFSGLRDNIDLVHNCLPLR